MNRIYYHNKESNFGDTANLDLVKTLTGKEAVFVTESPAVLGMGSILDHPTFPTIVWGSGVLSDRYYLRAKPAEVRAVRGPLSRRWLKSLGVKAPEVYGDPGILFDRMYKRAADPEHYKLGVIPHYVDFNHPCLASLPEWVLKIDITEEPSKVVENLTSCKTIVSSALHGLITADAFGIPSVWVEFSNNVIGGGFKFHDYFQSLPGTNPRVFGNLRDCEVFPTKELHEAAQWHDPSALVKDLLDCCPLR